MTNCDQRPQTQPLCIYSESSLLGALRSCRVQAPAFHGCDHLALRPLVLQVRDQAYGSASWRVTGRPASTARSRDTPAIFRDALLMSQSPQHRRGRFALILKILCSLFPRSKGPFWNELRGRDSARIGIIPSGAWSGMVLRRSPEAHPARRG